MKRSIEFDDGARRDPAFGPTLHGLRRSARWSLQRLADATYYSASHLGNVERGTKPPTVALARACDEALRTGTTLQDLLAGQPVSEPDQPQPTLPPRVLQLPARPTVFVGRQSELADLERWSSDKASAAIVAVHGPPGIGKTQLALHWAHRVAITFTDGVLWVDLHGDTAPGAHASPSAVLGTWCQAFGVSAEHIPVGLDGRAALWRSLLAERHVLVVLDNAASAAQVRPLLPSGPRSRTLITSRDRLSDVSIRDGARHLHLPPLSEDDARALLTATLGAATVTTDPDGARMLARRADGLPHRLRLIAEYSLQHPEKTLTDLAREPDPTHAEPVMVAAPEDRAARWREQPEEIEMPGRANAGRVYNYYLGGADNFADDREFGRRSQEIIPEIKHLARVNRSFLARALRDCGEQGIRQFIDIGASIPPAGLTHEILRDLDPAATLVYVDRDPIIVSALREMVADLDTVGAVLADLRDPTAVLHNPTTASLIDFAQPVALLMGLLLHFIPDEDNPVQLLATYREALAPGSHLIISHDTSDGREEDMRLLAEHYARSGQPLILRNRVELTQLATGFTLIPPGIVHMPLWRPDPADPPVDQPERSCAYALVLRT